MNGYKSSILWQSSEKLLRIASGLFIGIWIARYLGTEKFGVYSYIQSFVGMFAALATLGLDGIVAREIINKGKVNDLIGTALVLRLFGSTLLVVFVFLVAVITNFEFQSLLVLYSFVYVLQTFYVFDYFFQAKVKGKVTGKIKIISLLLGIFLKVYFILSGGELSDFITVLIIEVLIISVLMFFVFTKSRKITNLVFDFSTAKELLNSSWPLIFSGFIMSIYMKVDQVMLYHMLSAEKTGIYAAAVRIADSFNFLPVIICSVLFPIVLQSKKTNAKSYHEDLMSLHAIMFWLSILIAITFSLFSDFIISNTYGVEYKDAVNVLIIYTWASIPVFLSVSTTTWILSENLQKYKLLMDVSGATLNIGLNLLMIPSFGIYGAAFASLASYSLTLILVSIFNKDLRLNMKLILKSIPYPFFNKQFFGFIKRRQS